MGGAIVKEAGTVRRTYARVVPHKDGSYRVVQGTVWADPETRLVYAMGRVQGSAHGNQRHSFGYLGFFAGA